MGRNLGAAGLAAVLFWALAMAAGCEQTQGPSPAAPAPKAAPAAKAADGWTVVYAADFTKAGKLPDRWTTLAGEGKIEAGALVLAAPADAEGQLVLLEPRVPGSVRLEFVASLKGTTVSDISPFLNGDTSGYAGGYLFQFGGKGNTLTFLCRYEEEIGSTVKNAPLVKPGQKHRVLVENDGGRLRMVIDGQEVFRHTDPQPLKGPSHDRLGFYTWGCTLTIDQLTVSAKPAEGAAK